MWTGLSEAAASARRTSLGRNLKPIVVFLLGDDEDDVEARHIAEKDLDEEVSRCLRLLKEGKVGAFHVSRRVAREARPGKADEVRERDQLLKRIREFVEA